MRKAQGLPIHLLKPETGDMDLGEWVMDDATNRVDHAVTSPGLFGSFPWVDNERQYAGFLFVFNLKNKGREEKYILN